MANKSLKYFLDGNPDSPAYLPPFLRDFHDAKDFFKALYYFYEPKKNCTHEMPGWISAHIFTVDFFLHFCARCGYTLQKSRAKVPFERLEDKLETAANQRANVMKDFLQELKKEE